MKKNLILFFVVLLALMGSGAAQAQAQAQIQRGIWVSGVNSDGNGEDFSYFFELTYDAADGYWKGTRYFAAGNRSIKFANYPSWNNPGQREWGNATGLSGTAIQATNSGPNINFNVPENGSYKISLQDVNGNDPALYSIVKVEAPQYPDLWLVGSCIPGHSWDTSSNAPKFTQSKEDPMIFTLEIALVSTTGHPSTNGFKILTELNWSNEICAWQGGDNGPVLVVDGPALPYRSKSDSGDSKWNIAQDGTFVIIVDQRAKTIKMTSTGPADVAVTPSLTASGGNYPNGTKLTLTPDPSAAVLEYQVNGTGSWTTYLGAITLPYDSSTGTTYSVRAVDSDAYKITGSNDAGVVSYGPYVTAKTSVTITPTVGNLYVGESVSFTATPTVALQYSLNGGAAQSYTSGSAIGFNATGAHSFVFSLTGTDAQLYTLVEPTTFTYTVTEIPTYTIKVKPLGTNDGDRYKVYFYDPPQNETTKGVGIYLHEDFVGMADDNPGYDNDRRYISSTKETDSNGDTWYTFTMKEGYIGFSRGYDDNAGSYRDITTKITSDVCFEVDYTWTSGGLNVKDSRSTSGFKCPVFGPQTVTVSSSLTSGNTYYNRQTVTFSTVPAAAVAFLEYSTDNGTTWTDYTGAITLPDDDTTNYLVQLDNERVDSDKYEMASAASFTFTTQAMPFEVSANPGGSTFTTASLSVTLNATYPSTIYYTLDGTTPTTSSPSVTNGSSIVIGETATLKFYGVRASDSATSPVVTESYTKNYNVITATCASATAAPESLTFYPTTQASSFKAKLFVKGGVTGQYSLDRGLSWTTYNNYDQLTIDKSTTLMVKSSDGAVTTYNYTFAPTGALPTKDETIPTTNDNIHFSPISPSQSIMYRGEPSILRFKVRVGGTDRAQLFVKDSGKTYNITNWDWGSQTSDLSPFLIGSDTEYNYYQIVIDDGMANFYSYLGTKPTGTYDAITDENALRVFGMQVARGGNYGDFEKYEIAYEDGYKIGNTRTEYCLVMNHYQQVNKDLPNLLAEMYPNSGVNWTSMEWYMSDPTYYKTEGGKRTNYRWDSTKYQPGRTPWINSTNVGTVVYYAKSGGTEYKINVTVLPQSSSSYDRMTVFFEGFEFGNGELNCWGTALGRDILNGVDYGLKTSYWHVANCDVNVNDYTNNEPRGEYAFIKELKSLNFNGLDQSSGAVWRTGLRPPSGSGYMYAVNADYQAGHFYQQTVPVCTNTKMRLSFWIASLTNGRESDHSDAAQKYHAKPNVHLQVTKAGTTEVIAETWTGEIQSMNEWEEHFLDFVVGDGVESVTIHLLNVAGGGVGNDFALDDIRIEREIQDLRFETPSPTCIKDEAGFDFTIEVDDASVFKALPTINELGGTIYYKWTEKTAGGDVETNVSGASGSIVISSTNRDLSDLDLKFPNNTAHAKLGKVYTLYLSTNGNADSDFTTCGTMAAYELKSSEVEIGTSVELPAAGICPGSPVTLVVSDTDLSDDAIVWMFQEVGALVSEAYEVGRGKSLTVYPTTSGEYFALGLCYDAKISVTVKPSVSLVLGENAGDGTSVNVDRSTGLFTYRLFFDDQDSNLVIPYFAGDNITASTESKLTLRNTLTSAGTFTITPNTDAKTGTVTIALSAAAKKAWAAFANGANMIELTLQLAETDAFDCAFIQDLNIRLISPTAVWSPSENLADQNDNWNDDANWKIYNPKTGVAATSALAKATDPRFDYITNASAGVPMAGTKVIIPGTVNVYPVLKAAYTQGTDYTIYDYNFSNQPICEEVYFESGGEIGKPHYLEYLKAKVEINMGYYNGQEDAENVPATSSKSTSKMLNRDRYYTMSAPLKNVVAGDLFIGSKPAIYINYAEAIDYEGQSTWGHDGLIPSEAKFTVALPWSSIELSPSRGFGWAVNHSKGQDKLLWGSTNPSDLYLQKNLEAYKGILQLPNFEDQTAATFGDVSGVAGPNGYGYTPHSYFDGTKTTFRYHKLKQPDVVEPNKANDEIARPKNNVSFNNGTVSEYDAYRFVINGAADYEITATAGTEMLIGNPFMSHLDFCKFYLENKDLVANYFRVWNGTNTYTVWVNETTGEYLETTQTESSTDNDGNISIGETKPDNLLQDPEEAKIRPLQSVFIPIKAGVSGNLKFTPAMSVTKTGAVADVLLRSGNLVEDETLKVSAVTEEYGTSVIIVRRPTGISLEGSISKMFSGEDANVPELYIAAKSPLEIGMVSETTETVPLAIRTSDKGKETTLSFEGLADISTDVKLYDKKRNLTIPLNEDENTYSFFNEEGNQEDRFFIYFAQNEQTGTSDVAANKGFIAFAKDNQVNVISSPDNMIQAVSVRTVQGQLLSEERGLSTISYTVSVPEFGVYLVEVTTKNSNGVAKVVNY